VQPAVRQTHCAWRYFHLNTNHYRLADLLWYRCRRLNATYTRIISRPACTHGLRVECRCVATHKARWSTVIPVPAS